MADLADDLANFWWSEDKSLFFIRKDGRTIGLTREQAIEASQLIEQTMIAPPSIDMDQTSQ